MSTLISYLNVHLAPRITRHGVLLEVHGEEAKQYDRLGLVDEYTNILGVNIPSVTIPVRPGRNLAVIVEVAAMNNRQKRMGYNAAEELNQRLLHQLEQGAN